MPRKATGQVVERGGRFYVRCTYQGARRAYVLESGTLAEAQAEGAAFAAIVAVKGFPNASSDAPAPPDETVSKWWERYLAYREAKGQRSVREAGSRFRKWIEPVIGKLPMRAVNRGDLEAIVRDLDAAVLAGTLSAKTAANVFGEITGGFREACESKRPDLRARIDYAAERVRGPDRGVSPERSILYPDEALALLGCDVVPFERRCLYALALFLGARSSELAALDALSFNLTHGRVTIVGQIDRDSGETRSTKTGRVRSFDLEVAVRPLVAALVERRRAGAVLDLPPLDQRAGLLREDLMAAGVTRSELHENLPGREWLTFHDLRHTCLTWMAARGDDPLRIQWRAGHTAFAMTEKYLRAAKNLPGNFGEPFPKLPLGLVKAAEKAAADAASSRSARKQAQSVAETHGNRTHRSPREGRTHPF